jgi:hypothetical protein
LTSSGPIGRPEVKGVYSPDQKVRNRNRWIAYKLEVFAAYGGPVCVCCGEAHVECLSIDHIKEGGAQHRKELNGDARDGRNFYVWLKQNGYPPGFQVLCMNCNFAKGHFKVCPHELERGTVVSNSAAQEAV